MVVNIKKYLTIIVDIIKKVWYLVDEPKGIKKLTPLGS